MTPLRIVVAPSGFKESLSAEQVAQAIAAGIQRAAPDAVITQLPLVDGGEGFAKTLTRVARRAAWARDCMRCLGQVCTRAMQS